MKLNRVLVVVTWFKRKRWIDYLVVFGVGLGILFYTYLNSFPQISWSDEVVYAVMGRNIAEGRGLITNFYVPEAIIEAGYPLGDVHMPGHMFFLAFFFWLFGPSEGVALLPNQLSFLVSGLLLYWLGQQLFNRWAGFLASVFFFLFPAITAYVHTAMAELTLILLFTFYLAVWYKTLTRPRLVYGLLLSGLLVMGAVHREIFLLLLPTAVYSLWQFPPSQRKKALFWAGSVFLSLMLILFLPLYQARAPYPHALSDFLDLSDLEAQTNFLANNLVKNLSLFFDWSNPVQIFVHIALVFPLITAAFQWGSSTYRQKQVILFFLFSFFVSFSVATSLYTFFDWRGTRLLLILVPVGVLLLSGYVADRKGVFFQLGLLACLLAYFSYGTVQVNHVLATDRREIYLDQNQEAQTIIAQTQGIRPRTVIAKNAFLYGWQAYPATVIWQMPADPFLTVSIEETVPIDVIVLSQRDKDMLIAGVETGMLKGNYQLVDEAGLEGFYIFVNVDRWQEINAGN